MSDECDTGIILNKYPYSETSLIVVWLSQNHGIISTIARGVFKQGTNFFGKIDLFYHANFEFRANSKTDLYTLKEVSLIETFSHLREDFMGLSCASYCAFLIQKLVERETPTPELFNLFLNLLHLIKEDNTGALLLQFEIIILHQCGELQPFDGCRPDTKVFIHELIRTGKIIKNLKTDNRMVGELHSFIVRSLPDSEHLMKLRRIAFRSYGY